MSSTLNKVAVCVVLLSMTLTALPASAQTGSTTKKQTRTKTTSPAVTAEDIRALRQMLEQQQQQIEQLRQQLNQRDEQARAAQQAADQARQAADAAAQKAEAAQTASTTDKEAFTQMQSDVADLKTNVGNVALNAQDVDKRVAAAEGLAGRFRLSGDVRVRGESFFQSYAGCGAACADRWRARIRVRLGIDGKLNEDFIGGLALATGAVVNGAPDFKDPTSTNETLTSFYERKTIGLDRGFVTWNPHYAKWFSATGGKWAYSWNRAALTFDSDLNPEGFNEKINFDLHNDFVKNVNVQALQLFYNEVASGADSNAVGMSASAKVQLGKRVTWTPTYTALNWNGSDAIAQAAFPVTLPNPNTTPVGTPTATPTVQPVRTLAIGNSFTNATVIIGTGGSQRRGFVSDFLYSDFINDFNIVTPWKRLPARLFIDYEKNLRARAVAPAGKQDTAYWIEAALGQQKNRNDIQFGYSFADIDQDAVISQFNESDMRAPTNVKQHRMFANWLVAQNTTASITWWRGHTKYTGLQNAARASGVPAFGVDPWLNRLQFDIIYKF